MEPSGIRPGPAPGRRAVLRAGWAALLVAPGSALAGPAAGPAWNPVRAEISVDATAGRVVRAFNEDAPIRPASLAKMMTLELLLAACEPGGPLRGRAVLFSERAASMPRTRLGAPAGAAIGAADAAAALSVHSCNDVAVAVAEAISGSEGAFASRMTERAAAMGLRSTRFANASGLPDPGNASTARDLVLLGALLVSRRPAAAALLGLRTWSWEGQVFENSNRMLLDYPGMEAGKTGFVRESGFNLFACASRGGRRAFAVVAGGRTAAGRDARMAELLDEALAQPRG